MPGGERTGRAKDPAGEGPVRCERKKKMKLFIGGYAQGKLNYVFQREKRKNPSKPESGFAVWDGEIPEKEQAAEALAQGKRIVINRFHEWVRTCMRQGEEPEERLEAFLKQCPGSMIISDEIGNGIVPVDGFERAYRERTGRLLVLLAERADEVVRVICGIGQKIK